MPRMSKFEFDEYCRRQPTVATVTGGEERESDLHEYIAGRCRYLGWLYFTGSMAHRTRRTVGEMDFTILAQNGKPLFVECKSATGKLSSEQLSVVSFAAKLGHTIHVISHKSQWDQIERSVYANA